MRIPDAHELSSDQIASLMEAVENAHSGLSVLPPEMESKRLDQVGLILDAVRAVVGPTFPTDKDVDSMVREILSFVQKARAGGFSPTVLPADNPETLCLGFSAFYTSGGEEVRILRNVKLTTLKGAGVKYPHLSSLELFHTMKGRRGCAELLTRGIDILDPSAVLAATSGLPGGAS